MKKTSVSLFVVILFLMFSSTVFAGTIFGPNQYDRTSGAPNIYTEMFSAAPGEALLTVTNGNSSGKHRVTSALIHINDEVVFSTDDFKQKDYILEIPLQLLASNSLAVELTSKPGTYLSIKITQQKTSVSFSCSPDSIFNGQTSTLSWSSVLADTVFIDNGIGDVPLNGSLTVSPTVTTTYTITATGVEGTASQQATIHVSDAQQPIVTLEASNTDIFTGDSVTLSWTSAHADTCEITPDIGIVALNGSLTVTPAETTTYAITATSFGGTVSSSLTITVTPIPVPTVILTAIPETITDGESSTLSWSAENADSVSINQGIGSVGLTGSYTVNPTETIAYTITATGPGGFATDHATVTVSIVPPPVVSLSASSTDIFAGDSVTLTWTSTDADSCEITPNIGAVALSGSIETTPTETATYTISATGAGGTTNSSVTVTVTPIPVPTVTLTATPESIIIGESSTLSWDSANVTDAEIDQGIGTVSLNGSLTVFPIETTTYTITAIGPEGAATDSVTVAVTPLTISITSPPDNDTIFKPFVMIRGTITNPLGNEVGVNVNGTIAMVNGNQFVANHVFIEEGENTITAIATDIDGNTATTSIMINAVTTGDYISINADAELGVSPLETTLKVDGSFSFTESFLSNTGPGVVEFLDSINDNEYNVRMTTSGIYFFTAEVTDDQSNNYTDTIAILVMDGAQLDALLKAKWNGMKTALLDGDVDEAVKYFAESSGSSYRQQFIALASVLDQIVGDMGEITLIEVDKNRIVYDLRTIRNSKTYSFQLLFVIEEDGIWRIRNY